MKIAKLLYLGLVTTIIGTSCSDEIMNDINKNRNDVSSVDAATMLPAAMLQTAFEVNATDISWYATVYVEHNAGTWGQSSEADRRIAQESSSLLNNNWVSAYDVLMILKDIREKTAPEGTEPNPVVLGIAQVLTAYNLSVLTDCWGEVPWSEALMGAKNLKPKFDKQSAIYASINSMLDEAIANLSLTGASPKTFDYIYGGDAAKWKKAAYSLKARYALRLTKVDNTAATKALTAITNGFSSAADALVFNKYEATATGENPWYQFKSDRTHLSVSQTLYNLMNERNDPRIEIYVLKLGGVYVPAPNGTATQAQGGTYSESALTANGRTAGTPLMTYHELKFIQAEAKLRTNDATWKTSLKEAIIANFAYQGLATGGDTYFDNVVNPRLSTDLNTNLKELLTQKYIAFYEFEAIEAYNDYRRTGIPTLNNPKNSNPGFVNRFPYGLSDVSSNKDNVPTVNIFTDKVWWAGGTEKVQ